MIKIEMTCDAAGCAGSVPLPFDGGSWDAAVMVDGDDSTMLIETSWMSMPEGWTVGDDDQVWCPAHPNGVVDGRHPPEECERRLKALPNYSPFRGTPAVFVCECGRRYAFHEEESEGASWVLVPEGATA